MQINFDMDGTLADLYGVENWLDYLMASNTKPYEDAKPLINLSSLARILNKLQKQGYELQVISWLAKTVDEEYNERVKMAKREWLAKHLPSVEWNDIKIVAYGTPKETLGCDILFDDEKPNRDNWCGIAYDASNILEILKGLN